MVLKHRLLFLLGWICYGGSLFAQSPAIADSLQRVLKSHPQADTGRVNLLNQLARVLVTQDGELAQKYSSEALELAGNLHYNKGRVLALRNQALGENFKGNLDQQMELTVEALQIAERLKDKQLMAILLNDEGNIYIEEANADRGLPLLLRSLELKKELKDKAEISKTLNNIGTVYLSDNMPDSALYFLRQSEALKLAMNDHRGLAYTYENMGLAHRLLGNHNNAFDYLDLSRQYYEETHNLQGLTKIYLDLAQTSAVLRKFKEADRYFVIADSLNEIVKNPKNKMIAFQAHAVLDSARGDYKKALADYKEYAMLNTDYFNVQKDRYMTNAAEKYESEKKQRENDALLHQQQAHLATIRHQRMLEVSGLLVLVVILGITFLVFRLNRKLNLKNAESLEQNKIIVSQNEKLESLVQVKDRIFSVISHDLRSPLAILDGLLFLLRDEKIPPEQFRQYTNELWRDTKNTAYMMDNLLQWASSQMKGLRLQADDFDLVEALHQEFDLLCTLSRQKEVHLFSELEGPLMVYADQDMIKLVLRNLISNAVKFTPAGGRIRIFATRHNGLVEVSVADNGTGIPASEYSKIFSHIYYSTTGTQNEKGCGLGLPLSKEFIERNNGTIRFVSEENVGTTFTFTVPVSEEEEIRPHHLEAKLAQTK